MRSVRGSNRNAAASLTPLTATIRTQPFRVTGKVWDSLLNQFKFFPHPPAVPLGQLWMHVNG
ncbi:protein of unknown function (plasmid) [Pararobbsia alpina]